MPQRKVEMSLLDKKALLNYKSQLRTIEVTVGDNDTVFIQEMSVETKERFDASVTDKNGQPNYKDMNSKLLVSSMVDADGNHLLEIKDAPKLRQLPYGLVDRLVQEIIKLNALADDSVEELAKN